MPRIVFVESDGTRREVDAPLGLSVLEIAHRNGVDIEGACEGSLACSTCHVKVKQGFDCFPEATDDELDQLDEARDVGLDSRLACQAKLERVPDGGAVEVVVPSWNVNIVKEGH